MKHDSNSNDEVVLKSAFLSIAADKWVDKMIMVNDGVQGRIVAMDKW